RARAWKSIDGGETWADLGAILTDGTVISFDVYYERWTDASFGQVAHVLGQTDFSPRGLRYGRINLGTDVIEGEAELKSWGAEPSGGKTSIVVDSAGNLHAFGGGGVLSFAAWHLYSEDNGATWSDTRSMTFTPGIGVSDLFRA